MGNEPKQLFDNPRNIRAVVGLLIAVCAVVLVADLFYDKHGHYAFENRFGFHALFGFVTFFGLVLAGKHLRRILKRDEDYYDR
jgi:hypothetical protein